MSKKFIFVLMLVVFFSGFHLAFASPVINELMYDLDGADIDWVEIYNPDAGDIDLTTLKLLISNSTSNHGIVKYSGSDILHSGEYGIIVPSSDIGAFTNKWGSGGNIFTASFSLSNENEKVEINAGDKTQPLSSVTYNSTQGANGDGNSLQLINGAWKAALPTPGLQNKNLILPPSSSSGGGGVAVSDSSTTTDTNSSTTITSKKKEKVIEVSAIKTKITAKNLAFVDLPLEFKGSATGLSNEPLNYGKYFWNFGDGDSKETMETEKFSHTYFYPGEYEVSLEYYANHYAQVPDAIDKITVKVVPLAIFISKVGDSKDFFIELTNNSDYQTDISRWSLVADNKIFVLPKNSIIMPKKVMTISGKITKFTEADVKNLKLSMPLGEVAFDYGASLTPVEVLAKAPIESLIKTPAPPVVKISVAEVKNTKSNLVKTNVIKTAEVKNPIEAVNPAPEIKIPPNNLSASALSSDQMSETGGHLYPLIIGFVILLGFGASVAYFIRRKKIVPETGYDFQILDE